MSNYGEVVGDEDVVLRVGPVGTGDFRVHWVKDASGDVRGKARAYTRQEST